MYDEYVFMIYSMAHDPINICKATYKDIFNIYNIQCNNYSDTKFWESVTFLHHVVSLGLSYVAKSSNSGSVVGYALCHFISDPTDPPRLNSILSNHGNKYIFIHDICVDKAYQCQGIASKLLNTIHEYASSKHIPQIYLIAVQNAQSFWARHGYEKTLTKTIWEYCREYSKDASYMYIKIS